MHHIYSHSTDLGFWSKSDQLVFDMKTGAINLF